MAGALHPTSRRRDDPSTARNDPYRDAGTNITEPEPQPRSHAGPHHGAVTTGHDPAPDRPRRPGRALSP
jgi:hypothetical protein